MDNEKKANIGIRHCLLKKDDKHQCDGCPYSNITGWVKDENGEFLRLKCVDALYHDCFELIKQTVTQKYRNCKHCLYSVNGKCERTLKETHGDNGCIDFTVV